MAPLKLAFVLPVTAFMSRINHCLQEVNVHVSNPLFKKHSFDCTCKFSPLNTHHLLPLIYLWKGLGLSFEDPEYCNTAKSGHTFSGHTHTRHISADR